MALADLQCGDWAPHPRTSVLVIDTSASMAARSQGSEQSRFSQVQSNAHEILSQLGVGDRSVVIGAGPHPQIISPRTDNVADAIARLRAAAPAPGEADLGAAIALGKRIAANDTDARTFVWTDGAVTDDDAHALNACHEEQGCSMAVVRGPPENVAITAFAARRYPRQQDQVELLVTACQSWSGTGAGFTGG